jgi:hypothetical protein
MNRRKDWYPPRWIVAQDVQPGDVVAVKVQTIKTAQRKGGSIMLYGTDSMHDYYQLDQDVLLISRATPEPARDAP